MDIHKLEVLLAVVDQGSFTKAGEDLGYTQSGITQMMKSLEHEVGFPLFIKGHRGVTLTKEGESLLPSIRNLLSANESLNQEISFLKGAKKGTIKIGAYISCALHWLPEIIAQFQEQYPGILFEILEGDERQLVDWIENHQVDLGFVSYQKNQSYEFIPVYDDPMLAVMPKGHPFTQYDEIPIEWYENIPFVVSEYTYVNEVHRLLNTYKVKPDTKYILSNDFSILSMVEPNLGVSILPGLILRGRNGNFEVRPLKPRAYRKLGMAVSSFDDLSPALKIFIKYARDYLLS